MLDPVGQECPTHTGINRETFDTSRGASCGQTWRRQPASGGVLLLQLFTGFEKGWHCPTLFILMAKKIFFRGPHGRFFARAVLPLPVPARAADASFALPPLDHGFKLLYNL